MLLAVAPKVYMDLTDMDCGYKRALMFFPDVSCDALERRCLTGTRAEEGPATRVNANHFAWASGDHTRDIIQHQVPSPHLKRLYAGKRAVGSRRP